MAKKVYLCEMCHHQYADEESADRCPDNHTSVSKMTVQWAGFAAEHGYGPDYTSNTRIPKAVRIQFSDSYGDYAVYVLSQVGPKGV